jgi:hypothetical protein
MATIMSVKSFIALALVISNKISYQLPIA